MVVYIVRKRVRTVRTSVRMLWCEQFLWIPFAGGCARNCDLTAKCANAGGKVANVCAKTRAKTMRYSTSRHPFRREYRKTRQERPATHAKSGPRHTPRAARDTRQERPATHATHRLFWRRGNPFEPPLEKTVFFKNTWGQSGPVQGQCGGSTGECWGSTGVQRGNSGCIVATSGGCAGVWRVSTAAQRHITGQNRTGQGRTEPHRMWWVGMVLLLAAPAALPVLQNRAAETGAPPPQRGKDVKLRGDGYPPVSNMVHFAAAGIFPTGWGSTVKVAKGPPNSTTTTLPSITASFVCNPPWARPPDPCPSPFVRKHGLQGSNLQTQTWRCDRGGQARAANLSREMECTLAPDSKSSSLAPLSHNALPAERSRMTPGPLGHPKAAKLRVAALSPPHPSRLPSDFRRSCAVASRPSRT
eukprot:gene8754-biopygen21173